MKIQGRKGHQLGPMGPLGGPPPAQESAPVDAPDGADRVDLTSTQKLRQLEQMVSAMPSVRTEKVEGLRGAIEEGSYHVESEKLARKVVDEALSQALLIQIHGDASH